MQCGTLIGRQCPKGFLQRPLMIPQMNAQYPGSIKTSMATMTRLHRYNLNILRTLKKTIQFLKAQS